MKQYLCLIIIALLLAACSDKEQVKIKKGSIYLQPYDNFTQQEAMKLKKELDLHLQEVLADSFVVEVLPNKPLTKDLLNDARTRYKGERMISSLKDSPSTTIALTHKDISIEYNAKGKPAHLHYSISSIVPQGDWHQDPKFLLFFINPIKEMER